MVPKTLKKVYKIQFLLLFAQFQEQYRRFNDRKTLKTSNGSSSSTMCLPKI